MVVEIPLFVGVSVPSQGVVFFFCFFPIVGQLLFLAVFFWGSKNPVTIVLTHWGPGSSWKCISSRHGFWLSKSGLLCVVLFVCLAECFLVRWVSLVDWSFVCCSFVLRSLINFNFSTHFETCFIEWSSSSPTQRRWGAHSKHVNTPENYSKPSTDMSHEVLVAGWIKKNGSLLNSHYFATVHYFIAFPTHIISSL